MNQVSSSPFPLLLLLSAVVLLILSVRIGRRIPAPGALGAAGILAITSFWSLIDALLHFLPGHELFLSQLGYVPTVLSGVGLLVIALDYRSRLDLLTPGRIALLLAIPAVTVVAAFTNGYHHLIWSEFRFERIGGLVYKHHRYGAFFPVHIAFQYILDIVASVLLIRSVLHWSDVLRRQALLVAAAMLIPWLANLAYVLRLGPWPGLDLTGAAFSASCVLLIAGILRYQLFDVVPVAHDSVIRQMQDGIVILDPEGRVLDMNPAARAIFHAGSACIGRPPSFVVQTADGPLLLGAFASPSSSEVSVDDSWFDLTVSPLQLGRSRTAGRTVVLRDITARRREQEELRSALQRVETLAVHAQSANRAKSEFLAAMSHEIRTPMNAVLGASDLLSDTPLDTHQREYNELIRSAGTTLMSIINDILDLSKAEAGRIETEMEPFPVLDVVDQVIELVDESARRKGLSVILDIDEHFSPWAKGDASRFRQILLNLMSNAVKFTATGTVEIRIRSGSGTRTRFEVEDTGIGVPHEAREQLFEVFRQGDPSMTRRYGGTGLGLAIARRLTELMKGSIGFESEPGQGSLFWFELPLEPCAPAEQEHGARFSSRPAGVIASRTTRRLLLSRLRTIGLTPAAFPSEAAAWADLPEGSLLFVEQVGSVTAKLRDGQSVTLAVPIRLSQLILRLETLLPDEAHSASEDLNCLRGMRVLLAEDNAVNAHLARSLLQKFGMNVAIADNGAKAVSAYALEPYDLVLMDLQMPEMDGFEATRRIRGIERAQQLQRTPVVALTANVFRSERESCHAAGMDDFVAKPVERQELQRVLVRWCRNARAEA